MNGTSAGTNSQQDNRSSCHNNEDLLEINIDPENITESDAASE